MTIRLNLREKISTALKVFFQPMLHTQNTFTILVPVFEETAALEFSVFYFRKLGLAPLYVLDSKRRNRKAEIEKIVGSKIVIYENDNGKTLESNFRSLATLPPTDWILRIDCDEVPGVEMLDFCNEFIASGRRGIVGFVRPQLLYRQGQLLAVADSDFNSSIATHQWRLFNRNRVRFNSQVHTPGFKVPFFKRIRAPASAKLFHLEWFFTTAEQRSQKSASYDSLGQAPHMKKWQMIDPDKLEYIPAEELAIETTLREWLAETGKDNPV